MKIRKLLEGEFNEKPNLSLSDLNRMLAVQTFHFNRLDKAMTEVANEAVRTGAVATKSSRILKLPYFKVPDGFLRSFADWYIEDTPESRSLVRRWKKLRAARDKVGYKCRDLKQHIGKMEP